jgi:hypothetical protein
MGARALVARERADGFALSYSQWGAADEGVPAVTEPLAAGLSWDDVLARVDFVVHEALWRVDATGTKQYVPCALALDPTRSRAAERGLLVRATGDAAAVRAFYEGAREMLAGVVAEGEMCEQAALARLEAALRDRFADREVIRVP